MKVAVIGGGSTYTPELLQGFVEEEKRLELAELWLMDIDAGRLKTVGDFCRRLLEKAGARFSLRLANEAEPALEGADFVITQIRVGGQAARHQDTLLGVRHGLVGQETTGVGGFSKALRTVPVLLELCRKMENRCPEAWLINFTNPSGLVTEALLKYGRRRVIGLCNIPMPPLFWAWSPNGWKSTRWASITFPSCAKSAWTGNRCSKSFWKSSFIRARPT